MESTTAFEVDAIDIYVWIYKDIFKALLRVKKVSNRIVCRPPSHF